MQLLQTTAAGIFQCRDRDGLSPHGAVRGYDEQAAGHPSRHPARPGEAGPPDHTGLAATGRDGAHADVAVHALGRSGAEAGAVGPATSLLREALNCVEALGKV